MTTVPCFAACATAKAELPKGKFKWTLLFWIAASFTVSSMVYTVGAFVWPLGVWVGVIALVATLIALRNTGKFDVLGIFQKKNKKENV